MMKVLKVIAIALSFAVLRADGATVTWSGTAGLGTLTNFSGTAVPLNSALIMIGTFQPTLGTGPSGADTTIKNLFASGSIGTSSTPGTILGDFTQFNTILDLAGKPGAGPNSGAGQWTYNDINSAAVFANQQVYMLAFNATTVGASTQMGIFTGRYNSDSFLQSQWLFPADVLLGSIAPELGDTTSPSGVIVGSLSVTNYKMAVIVPEPSSVALCAVAAIAIAGRRKRKRG